MQVVLREIRDGTFLAASSAFEISKEIAATMKLISNASLNLCVSTVKIFSDLEGICIVFVALKVGTREMRTILLLIIVSNCELMKWKFLIVRYDLSPSFLEKGQTVNNFEKHGNISHSRNFSMSGDKSSLCF